MIHDVKSNRYLPSLTSLHEGCYVCAGAAIAAVAAWSVRRCGCNCTCLEYNCRLSWQLLMAMTAAAQAAALMHLNISDLRPLARCDEVAWHRRRILLHKELQNVARRAVRSQARQLAPRIRLQLSTSETGALLLQRWQGGSKQMCSIALELTREDR